MGKVVSMEAHKRGKLTRRGLKEWVRVFSSVANLNESTLWSDLSDDAVLYFCEETEDSKQRLYQLLMSSHCLGCGGDIECQAAEKVASLLNAYFFITDQARFECMRRLGWVSSIPRADQPIIETVMHSESYSYADLMETPAPTPAHPSYEEDVRGRGSDRAALVRKVSPEAVRIFRENRGRKTSGK